MNATEKEIGDRVRQHREAAGYSQAELATLIREGGHKWSQATVWAVERGDRPLRVSEAALVARSLSLSLSSLVEQDATGQTSDFTRGVEYSLRAVAKLLDA